MRTPGALCGSMIKILNCLRRAWASSEPRFASESSPLGNYLCSSVPDWIPESFLRRPFGETDQDGLTK